MKQEYDDWLCSAYPKLYKERNLSVQESCMGRGFEVGDGWFNILKATSLAIQNHINWHEKQATEAIEWNEMISRGEKPEWWGARPGEPKPKKVPRKIPQVTITQVKEKFGVLRIYHHGGDKSVEAFIVMAEIMSSMTCEDCGVPGKLNNAGWLRTQCDSCRAQAEKTLKGEAS